MIYGDSDLSLSIVARERTCLFHWSASLDKVTQKYIKPSLQFQYKQICKDYKDAKIIDDAETKYHVILSWWLSSGVASEEGILGLSEWLGFWHFRYKQWDGHMLIVSTYQISLFNVIQISSTIIYILWFSCSYICVLFVGYDNRRTCGNVNMQPCRDCAQQMAPTVRQQDDLFI